MAFKRIWHQQGVLAALDAGATVVVSGERLARATRLAHGEVRHAAGARVWERPDVVSLTAFLDRLYDGAVEAALGGDAASSLPKRITDAACESHWEEAIRGSPQGAVLLQAAAAAREAARSWTLLQAYRIPLERLASGDEDAQAFLAWAEAFRSLSRAQGWLEEARLSDWLATRLREKALPVPARVLFTGFDELTPQQQELLESLRAAGSVVEVLAMEPDAASPARRRVEDDARAEERAAAAWARSVLEKDPAASIGIVARDLDACRASLARALDDALCPGAAAGQTLARPYELSLGSSLDGFPVVQGALALLELLRRRTPFPTVSLLLRSPFLAGADAERDARARLELRLRERVSETITLKALDAFAGTAGVPRLRAALQALMEKSATPPSRQLPSAWARHFADALTLAGWPGERALSSDEYQAVMALHDLIGSLVHLDAALGAIPVGEALTRLKRLAAEHIFQPAGGDAPVQVLGLLETSGLCFDHLWVMGMSDAAWPASPRPAAFIPTRLQREYGLPHASAAAELTFARRVTARLLISAGEVVVSNPAGEGDETLRPSPLVASLPSAAEPIPAIRDYRAALQAEYGRAAETHLDMRAPAVEDRGQVRGGAYLLAAQSRCAFQAFGTSRLGAKPLEEPALGPDALERGSVMHQVLHAVWSELKDHAGLMARDAAARRELVGRCAAAAVTARVAVLPEVYTPRVAELERERLTSRVVAWLEIEARRPPFRVLESEQEHRIQLGPLTLLTRIDRIDALADGGRLVLDYKTGRVTLQSWLEERPDDPQLPLYALGEREELAAVSYACLKPGETGFTGLAARGGMPEGIVVYAEKRNQPAEVPDWDSLLRYWERNLTQLAESYAAGDAKVDPKQPKTCEYCHLSTLCRVHELRGAELEEAETEAGDDE